MIAVVESVILGPLVKYWTSLGNVMNVKSLQMIETVVLMS